MELGYVMSPTETSSTALGLIKLTHPRSSLIPEINRAKINHRNFVLNIALYYTTDMIIKFLFSCKSEGITFSSL